MFQNLVLARDWPTILIITLVAITLCFWVALLEEVAK